MILCAKVIFVVYLKFSLGVLYFCLLNLATLKVGMEHSLALFIYYYYYFCVCMLFIYFFAFALCFMNTRGESLFLFWKMGEDYIQTHLINERKESFLEEHELSKEKWIFEWQKRD